MSTIRQQLADALTAALPTWRGKAWNVVELGREPDTITRPTVVLYRTDFKPLPAAPRAQYEQTLDVWVVIAPDGSDTTLDEWVDTLVGAIEDIPWATWTTASRDALRGLLPGYRVEVTANTEKTTEEPAP